MLVCVIGWIFDVSVTITICTCRVRRQKARVDKRQKKYAKFLAKWYFQTYSSEGGSAAKAKEVIYRRRDLVYWYISSMWYAKVLLRGYSLVSLYVFVYVLSCSKRGSVCRHSW